MGLYADAWRALPNPSQWQVTPETARLLQHWRHHKFGGVRPFFCQVEAAETAIWLTEVAPHTRNGKRIVVQCKFYSSPVGNKAVREAAAARLHERADQAIVVSNAAYTKAARQLAGTTGGYSIAP